MQENSILSPSFNPSSSRTLRREFDDPGDNMFDDWPQRQQQLQVPEEEDDKNEEQEFEFSVVFSDPENPTISADEIFHNGQIRPIYPLFDTSLLEETKPEHQSFPLPLGRLLKEERGEASWSSSESDELEGLAPGTYCVWTPKNRESPGIRKKSNSTGSCSSKRWKLRNILYRSNSDGKESRNLVYSSRIKRESSPNGAVE